MPHGEAHTLIELPTFYIMPPNKQQYNGLDYLIFKLGVFMLGLIIFEDI